MEENDVVEFDAFLERNWGIKPPKMPTAMTPNDIVDLDDVNKKDIKAEEELKADEVDEIYPKVSLFDDIEEDNDELITTSRIERERKISSNGTTTAETPKTGIAGKIKRNIGIKRPAGAAPTKPKANPTTENKPKTDTKQTKPRSSILGQFDDEE